MSALIKSALLVCYIANFVVSEHPKGHLESLGGHMPPIEIEVIYTSPSPQEFLDKYVKISKPVLIKGAAKMMDIYKLWKDDEYLGEKYGNWVVPIDLEKIEEEYAYNGGMVRMPFKWFLSNYKKKSIAIVREIAPQNPMRDEITFPQAMSCGGFQDRMMYSMLIFTSGSARSSIHWDLAENMHCLLDGTKEWRLIHRKDRHLLPISEFSSVYSAINPNSVDMYKHPVMLDMPWYRAFVEAGDCLYVPNSFPHYVRSGDSRTMALSFWFGAPRSLDLSDCPPNAADLPNPAPIGRGLITRLECIKAMIFMMIDDRSGELPTLTFYRHLLNRAVNDEHVSKMFEVLDQNDDLIISEEEIEALTNVTESYWDNFSYDEKEYKVLGEDGKIADVTGKDEL